MKNKEKKLLRCYAALPDEQAETLLAFAEFLAERYGQEADAIAAEPQPIPRPDEESVIAAIKRLSNTYPMLDRGKMLNETSGLMAQHIIQGRETTEVIDELEVIFRRHYEAIGNNNDNTDASC